MSFDLEDCVLYERLPEYHFENDLERAFRLIKPKSFLDVGCGLAENLISIAMKHPEMEFYGLEIRPEYLDLARKDKINIHFIEGDARTWDEYGAYDIVYMFHPLLTPENEIALERRVWELMKIGSVFILHGNLEESIKQK